MTLIIVGCAASTIDEPIPLENTSSGRGFRMFGEVAYTRSAEEARSVIQSSMDEACGGKAKLIRFEPALDISGPIDVVNYEAVAMCAR